jgi:type I restriction enzyme S subunit
VEWIGDVPAHWTIRRLSSLFAEKAEEGLSDLPILSVSIHDGVSDEELDPGELERKVSRSEDRSKYKRVIPGDLVYNMMRAWQGGFGAVQTLGMVSPAYVVARPKSEFSTQFIEHLLRTSNAVEEMRRHSRGVADFRLRLYWEEFKAIEVALPPPSEQHAIVEFLSRETVKIDALVEEQRRLIELLKEKRQAVVSQAVTKGLDPDAPMRVSGVKWIGKVPAHWRVLPLSRILSRIEQGWSPTACEREPDPAEASVLRLSAVKNGVFYGNQRKALPDLTDEQLSNAPRVQNGDFLLSRANTPELVGDCAIATDVQNTIFPDLMYRLTFSTDDVLVEFALLALRSSYLRGQISRDARGSSMSMAKLSHKHIKSWLIALPPTIEQRRIAESVAVRVHQLSLLMLEAESAIALLREYRSALISAAVTGRIDVRGQVSGTIEGQAA